jgi:hypothetical protein
VKIAKALVPAARAEAVALAERGPKPYTPDTAKKILKVIRSGNSRETAAASAGLAKSTLLHWLRMGSSGVEPYASFSLACDEAESDAKVEAVEAIRRAGKDDWHAMAWWLERSYPKEFGKNEAGLTLTLQASDKTPADARRAMREHFGEVTPQELGAAATAGGDEPRGPVIDAEFLGDAGSTPARQIAEAGGRSSTEANGGVVADQPES